MNEIKYNFQFDKLFDALGLGNITRMPQAVSGGLLNKMYAVETTTGKYAVKALNPQIMTRPEALQNYIASERIALIAAESIPALPARRFKGEFLHVLDKQYYLVFDWVNGRSLKVVEINSTHCEKIGIILAAIHTTDFSGAGITKTLNETSELKDWNFYLQKGYEMKSEWTELLSENMDKLYVWDKQAAEAAGQLADEMVISHRDMDCKNVLWHGGSPVVIDWEAAGFINPMHELVETAISWSETESGSIDETRFLAFLAGYKSKSSSLPNIDWSTVLADCYSGKLEWLEYNLKRSLMLDCTDEEERQLGTEQVIETVYAILRYEDMISGLERMLYNNWQQIQKGIKT